jgi:uncharacterized protein YbjT (DUF2867 family)
MILVTGATGNVGSETVRLLAADGQPVRALVHDTPPRDHPSSVDVIMGDLDDAASLDRAVRGVETVVMISPAVVRQEVAVIDAAVRGGVTHIVKASSKASADSPVERRRGQAQIEEHLLDSGLDWTVLRSNAYLQNLLALGAAVRRTSGFVMSAGDGKVGMVDAQDVAAVAATVAAHPFAHAGATYVPTGPALVSYADVADELTRELGRDIRYQYVTPDDHRALMISAGVPDDVATSNAQAFSLVAEGDAAWTTDDVLRLTGRAPRSLRAFIAAHRAAFA